MARIIENNGYRRIIKLSGEDILSVVREYQCVAAKYSSYKEIFACLNKKNIYIPEDV